MQAGNKVILVLVRPTRTLDRDSTSVLPRTCLSVAPAVAEGRCRCRCSESVGCSAQWREVPARFPLVIY
ncbi:hypothetical protein O3P69_006107 [Scylla paramamosain]|uniref:Uncharacterized protein n=1 Tax=Scylla paramamosain TaxID=85552 RepID=A0AAW0U795_SCYPA